MIDEADVMREYLFGDLSFRGAVICLQKLGYDPKDADAVVSEWADDAEGNRMASDGVEDFR
jgi:hypothetical protein